MGALGQNRALVEDQGFHARVYEVIRAVPVGKVTTYSAIAWALGRPGWARQVGWALAALPEVHDVPAHRVVNASGELSGTWAFGGPDAQRRLLEPEGVAFDSSGRVRLDQHLWLPG